jgi:serine/threonine protein kinase
MPVSIAPANAVKCHGAAENLVNQKYIGPKADIWSLGVIIYTILTGEMPFKARLPRRFPAPFLAHCHTPHVRFLGGSSLRLGGHPSDQLTKD